MVERGELLTNNSRITQVRAGEASQKVQKDNS